MKSAFLSEEVTPDIYVNIMGQYRPAGKVRGDKYSENHRRVSSKEMQAAYQAARDADLWRFDQW